MLNYIFKAKNNEGALITGEMMADRRENVVSALKQKGYYILNVEQEGKFSGFLSSNGGLGKRVSVRERAIFTQQLATLLRAGMQLTIALKTLTKQTENKYLATVIQQVQTDVEQSSSLSEAMARHSKVFSPVYTSIVAAAEQSGSLAQTLAILSKELKEQAIVRARIRGALVYPIFLLFVSAIVVGVLTTFVVPKFVTLFVNVNQKLPLPTMILVGTMDFFKGFWWTILIGIVAILCLILAALKVDHIRFYLDSLFLKAPVLGKLNNKLQLARFARTLGSLLTGGVDIVSAIKTTQGITSNRVFAADIDNIEEEVLKGSSLAEAARKQDSFSEIATNMISVGEDTGALPEMLLEVAEIYDQESESAINAMTALLGPVMIVVLGLIIGFVVIAILLPIFETSTMIS
ncbi:MAG: type II secretion system F family protein [Bacteroidales bacterium]|nr:type II secretion system F family protein [Bacteroidales bacterium]